MYEAKSWNQVVVGIDPGMTTGLAWAEGVRCAGTPYRDWWGSAYKTTKTIHAFGLGPDDVHDVVVEFMLTILDLWSDADSLMIVCEDFLLRPGPLLSLNRELLSPSIIGSVLQHELYGLFIAEEPGGRRWKLARELPSTTKNVITDDRLKRYGAWDALTPHERDAWRCVLTGLRKFHTSFTVAA